MFWQKKTNIEHILEVSFVKLLRTTEKFWKDKTVNFFLYKITVSKKILFDTRAKKLMMKSGTFQNSYRKLIVFNIFLILTVEWCEIWFFQQSSWIYVRLVLQLFATCCITTINYKWNSKLVVINVWFFFIICTNKHFFQIHAFWLKKNLNNIIMKSINWQK